jgi:hypothetical protein
VDLDKRGLSQPLDELRTINQFDMTVRRLLLCGEREPPGRHENATGAFMPRENARPELGAISATIPSTPASRRRRETWTPFHRTSPINEGRIHRVEDAAVEIDQLGMRRFPAVSHRERS